MALRQLKIIFMVTFLPLLHMMTLAEEESEALCINKICYTVHMARHNFKDAQLNCINNGGDLVTIKTQEEAEHVKNLLMQIQGGLPGGTASQLWIGLQLKNKCHLPHKTLKGFSWVTGDAGPEEKQFSNWKQEPKSTCTQTRCVTMKIDFTSPDNYKWLDGRCTAPADGYLCKFQFKGMCKGLPLGGPGSVEYSTPFNLQPSSLTLIPHGSMAIVYCEDDAESQILLCQEQNQNEFQWSNSDGPLCASPVHGCAYNNGSCEQECVEDTLSGSVRCDCREGYVLASDMVSCVLSQKCHPNPCHQNCINLQQGFQCTCFEGFKLAEDKINCKDVDECLKNPCDQLCTNTLGSYQCSCREGYTRQDGTCIDQDECIQSPCAHGCLNIHGSFHCSCEKGYELGDDGLSCLDVDECLNSPCAEMCSNTPGSYVCFCPEGFLLSLDGISCSPDKRSQNQQTNDQVAKGTNPKDSQTTSSMQRDNMYNSTAKPWSPDSVMDVSHRGNPKLITTSPMAPEVDSSGGDVDESADADKVQSGISFGQNTLLLVSTICACAVLLILAIVAGVVCYKRRNTVKEEDYKPPTATDNYCWVPEQTGNKAVNNDYR